VHGLGIDLVRFDQLFPDRNIQRAGIDLPARNRGDGGVMGARERDAFQVGVRVDLRGQQVGARHQVARRR
jgi:hypothetical protein